MFRQDGANLISYMVAFLLTTMECGGLISKELVCGATRCLMLVIVLSWVCSSAQPLYGADVYQGRVVDEETGQPLVGAVVTVVWFRSPIVGMEGTRDFQSAQEAIADSDGKFYLPVSPGSNWNPFSYIREEPRSWFISQVTSQRGLGGW